MDTKKVFWGIIAFLLTLVVILDFNNIRSFFVKPVDPLDAIYEYDGQEISVRKLFEASYEDIHYSNYWTAYGNYYNTYEYTANATGYKYDTPILKSSTYIELRYDHYYANEDNNMWILSGKLYNPDNHKFSLYGDLDYQSIIADYEFYERTIDGNEKSGFDYTGHKCYLYVNVEKILQPDFDNMEGVSIFFDGTVDEQGHFVVSLEGAHLPCLVSAFKDYNNNTPYDEAVYTFDAKSRMIISVNLINNMEGKTYDGNSSVSKSGIDITIGEISYGEYDIPEIPEFLCDNSLISGALTGDGTFKPSSVIRNDASDKSSLSSDISKIWQNAVSSMTNESCTVNEISDSLSENALKYGMNIVKQDYFINDYEYCIYIRYLITQDENEIGYIIMPLTVYGAQLCNGNNIIVFANDELSIYEDGSIWINHDKTSSITTYTCYRLYADGILTLDHKITRENAFSRLTNTEELSLFSFGDFAKLKVFVEDHSNSKYSRIDKYEIRENGYMNIYYVVDNTTYSEHLANDYDLPFISLDYANAITGDNKKEYVASWQSFD